jgi:putative ABC transport system permease protein
MRLSLFAYRLLLFAFPPDVRREFGDDMTAMNAKQIEDARSRPGRVTRLWIRAVADALSSGVAERMPDPPQWKGRSLMRAFVQDLKYACRVLLRQPGITFIAVLTLALGIGANTAIFSAVNAILLRPLPYEDPDRLMTLWEKRPAEGVEDNVVSPADFLDWAQMNTTFEHIAAMTSTTVDLTGNGEPERLFAGVVSPPFFDVLGIRPMLGRGFRPDEAVAGKPRVAIFSHSLWTSRFGADPSVVGRTVMLNGVGVEVVGVLPASFEFPDESLDIWTPLVLEGTPQPQSRTSHQLLVYGRLKPGITREQARTDMERVGALLAAQYPAANRTHTVSVIPLDERLKQPVRGSLLMLFGAVGFVLLIACVNVANILLARSAGRRREMAVRSAVGAGRSRLVGQVLTESLVLAAIGGAAALVVAWWAIEGLKQLAPASLAIVNRGHLRLEPRVLAFTAVISLATGLLFGLLPAWQLASQDAGTSLKEGGRSPGGVRRGVRIALVVSEIALASLLLVAAGLTLRSFQSVLKEPAGFRLDRALTLGVSLPGARYRTSEERYRTFTTIQQRLGALPGVRTVGITNALPLGGRDGRQGVTIEGREPTPDTPTRAHMRTISPEYFRAMGIHLLAGRAFTDQDDATGIPSVVIVNDTMAKRYWPGASPIGKRVKLNGANDPWMEVIGVIADVRHWGLDARVNPELYFTMRSGDGQAVTFVLDADVDPASLAPAVREQVRAIDPNLPLPNLRTMADVAAASVASRRAGMLLIAVFGGLALLLAAAGIHGVMSHLVALRTGEIGVRMTLGARPSSVMGLILREGTLQAIVGLAIGLTGGVLVMRTFGSMLYGVHPFDPLTLGVVAIALLVTALAACAVPARRAMRVDPVTALRT